MRFFFFVLLTALLAAPAAAQAVPARDVYTKRELARHKDLWATVNVCDTEKRPNVLGIRASMPGDGRRLELFMRFRVEYKAVSDGRWHASPEHDSGFQRVGLTRRQVRESGYSFAFEQPAEGSSYKLRGLVTFEWRNRKRALRRLRETTTEGHRSSRGADPPRFTAATCEIR